MPKYRPVSLRCNTEGVKTVPRGPASNRRQLAEGSLLRASQQNAIQTSVAPERALPSELRETYAPSAPSKTSLSSAHRFAYGA